jgi:DNA ligase 4
VIQVECGQEALSIFELDALLDELAALSSYSHALIRSAHPAEARRPRATILRALYSASSAFECACITQIILKDLRPLLYPTSESHYSTALTLYNSVAVATLTCEDAMRVWDPSGRMLRARRTCAQLDLAAVRIDEVEDSARPNVGTLIQIPKCVKGQSCAHTLRAIGGGSSRVWAETKYDGERVQIHLRISSDGTSEITTFSKNKRDSTHDLYAVHWSVANSVLQCKR